MDIAAMSVVSNQLKIQQQKNISVMKMAMNTGKEQMNELVRMMKGSNQALAQAIEPHLGKTIDIRI